MERIDMKHFSVLERLGEGSYGQVFLVEKTVGVDAGMLYALKTINKAMVFDTNTQKEALAERDILEATRDVPFVVHMHYAFQTDINLHIIMDFVSGGALSEHLENAAYFMEDEARIYIGELTLALEKLHKLGIVHRDIKLENILLDRSGHVVLVDFGLSKMLDETAGRANARSHTPVGTLEYMAPEIACEDPTGHSYAADWYSLGVVAYRLMVGHNPFECAFENGYIRGFEPEMPKYLTTPAIELMLDLLYHDPYRRLGGGPGDAAEVKAHTFFATASFSWSELESRRVRMPVVPEPKRLLDISNAADEFADVCAPSCRPAVHTLKGYSYVSPSLKVNEHEDSEGSNSSPDPLQYVVDYPSFWDEYAEPDVRSAEIQLVDLTGSDALGPSGCEIQLVDLTGSEETDFEVDTPPSKRRKRNGPSR